LPGSVVGGGDVSFILRTALPLAAVGPAVRERVGSVDDAVPITSITTMQQRIADTLAPQRYRMRLMLAFSTFAGLFAVTGVYGVLSRSAARRRRELGIRAALGAARPELARLLLRQSLLLTMGGVIAGVAVSSLATRVLATMLFETSPNDPVTLSAIVLLMLTLTLLAAALPAKRAAATDPAEIMRI
jgi:putative ABC transport system permease protein